MYLLDKLLQKFAIKNFITSKVQGNVINKLTYEDMIDGLLISGNQHHTHI